MYQKEIQENEAGQRLDKFLHKFMPLAPSSFFYKMLRKKNIKLNSMRAEGNEKLQKGDLIHFYLSEETIKSFQGNPVNTSEYLKAYESFKNILVIYEDENIVVMNKPIDVLSQKAKPNDLSINEWFIGYLLHNGLNPISLNTFKPSICNRLDRNTQGLIIGAKSLIGSQEMSRLISERRVKKFYRLFVKGIVSKEEILKGYLIKDEQNNKVHLVQKSSDESSFIQTRYYPIQEYGDKTLVEVELITGKSHQIRVHMASVGHPLLGDYKYGNAKWNDQYKKNYKIESQLLYACKLIFPQMDSPFETLSEKIIDAPIPYDFQQLIDKKS